MDKLGDFTLFVKIVQHNGLAAAGRELGISPASVSSRLTRLEENYAVRLINRTTRKIALTSEGREFYRDCLGILSEIDKAEEQLLMTRDSLSGNLKITAPIDLGKQHIAPLLADFVKQNPNVTTHLNLSDHVVNFIDGGYDLAIRYGALKENRMVAKKIAGNKRMLCASPAYLEQYGVPATPDDLSEHQCLVIERGGESLNNWYFTQDGKQTHLSVRASLSSNDGSQVREWALQGMGVALKSHCDIEPDLTAGRLIAVLDDYDQSYDLKDSGLYVVYLSRKYVPIRIRVFIDLLTQHFR